MLVLTDKGLEDRRAWTDRGYALPEYDRSAMKAATLEAPKWVHFGAGNIFRAFQANAMQKMLNKGEEKAGIVAVDGFDYEIIEKNYRPHDNLSVLATLKADGTVDKTVIGSIGDTVILDSNRPDEYSHMKDIFTKDSLQMASFTITEKGYSLTNAAGEELPAVTADIEAGIEKPQSYMGKVVSLLYARFKAGQKPIAMVSMDNCSHNGEKLFTAIDTFAKKWAEAGKVEKEFVSYIEDSSKVSFPWTMIDKITPRPDKSVEALLEKDGLDLTPAETSRHTFIAPFVNSEETEYLVIEDDFPNGRMHLEDAGFYFTDRDTVNKVERMKVTTCLNPLHTALAVYGCILGYDRISAEMKDEDLVNLIRTVGYKEGLPVVTDPKILNPKEFIDTVVNVRIPNPFMPDTPQRIATDTSQKLSIRYGETIKAYIADPNLDVQSLKAIPLVQAGWLRYLMGVNDNGEAFELSPDPLLDEVRPFVADVKLGQPFDKAKILPLLKNEKIFGLDLEKAGLSDKVLADFAKLTAGKGAVRDTLRAFSAETKEASL
jgi:fructuronate reductase